MQHRYREIKGERVGSESPVPAKENFFMRRDRSLTVSLPLSTHSVANFEHQEISIMVIRHLYQNRVLRD